MTLGELVREELRRQRRSQRSLALEIGVSPMTVGNVLKGSQPDLTTIYKLSRFLHEPIGILIQAAGIAPWLDSGAEQTVLPMVDDWPTLKVLHLMRGFTKERRRRVLRIVELLDEVCREYVERPGCADVPGPFGAPKTDAADQASP